MSEKLIENGLIDTILDTFESDKYPDVVYKQCIMPIATFSKTDAGRKHLKERGFDLKRFAVKLDQIDDHKTQKAGVACIKNLATEDDLNRALKGLDDMNDDD